MEWGDETAVASTKAGDKDAFRVLVERHSRPLFRVAYRMTGNEQDAEDVVQETLLRAYRSIEKFDERASFRTWLHRIAVNCSLDLVRARKRRLIKNRETYGGERVDPMESIPAPGPTPDRVAMSLEARGRIAGAMEELTTSERAAFVMRHFEGMCIEDISQILGCRPGAAKHRVFRAVQKLRRALEPLVRTAK